MLCFSDTSELERQGRVALTAALWPHHDSIDAPFDGRAKALRLRWVASLGKHSAAVEISDIGWIGEVCPDSAVEEGLTNVTGLTDGG